MRGVSTRLSKLEAKRGPRAEALFYVFGMDEGDAAERAAAELRSGAIGPADPLRMPIWRGTSPPPAPRWAAPTDLTDEELEDAIADLSAQVGREVHPRGAMEGDTLSAALKDVQSELIAGFHQPGGTVR